MTLAKGGRRGGGGGRRWQWQQGGENEPLLTHVILPSTATEKDFQKSKVKGEYRKINC